MDSKPILPDKESDISLIEKAASFIDRCKSSCANAWSIALRMTKGAYLLSERKRLFKKLGEEVYYKIKKGEFPTLEFENRIHEIDRLTKKVELEELQIRTHYHKKNKNTDDTDILNTSDFENSNT